MLIYDYKGNFIRCFVEGKSYYFCLSDISKSKYSRAYLTQYSKKNKGVLRKIEGDKFFVIYVNPTKISNVRKQGSLTDMIITMWENFNEKNLKYVDKKVKLSVKENKFFDVENFINTCVIKKYNDYYFRVSKFYKYFKMSETWHEKRIRDYGLKSVVSYSDLKNFFKTPIVSNNKYLKIFRDFILLNDSFSLNNLIEVFSIDIQNKKEGNYE